MARLEVIIPEGYMNLGISRDNDLIMDNNNFEYFNILKFKLPKEHQWDIYKVEGNIAILKDKIPTM